jgi:hypothetical protein
MSHARLLAPMAAASLGQYGRAIAMAEDAIGRAEIAGNRVNPSGGRGDLAFLLAEMGAVERGRALARQAVALGARFVHVMHSWTLARQARIELIAGDLVTATAAAAESQALVAGRTIMPSVLGVVGLAQIEVRLAESDWPAALDAAAALESDIERVGLPVYLAKTLLLRASAELGLGRGDAARASLARARQQAEATGERGLFWHILAAEAQMAEREGDRAAARRLRREAQLEIEWIAEQAGSPELADTFRRQARRALQPG